MPSFKSHVSFCSVAAPPTAEPRAASLCRLLSPKRQQAAPVAARQPAAQGSQRREAASGASSQRRKLQPRALPEASSQRKTEPGLYGRMANPQWKVRISALFRMRHWVDPQQKEAFIRELEAIKVQKKFQGMTYCSTAHTSDSRKRLIFCQLYKREVGRILGQAAPKVHWMRTKR